MQPLALEGKLEVIEIGLARPIAAGECFLELRGRGVGLARAGRHKRLDMVGEAVEGMPLAQQEVTCRASRVGGNRCDRYCQNQKRLPRHKIHYFRVVVEKNH